MVGIGAVLLFVVALAVVDRFLRRRDRDGYWDADWRSSAAHVGMKFFAFDKDGIRQRPARS
ncbi:MAG: hypothetical protein KY460_04665 [Actinobacteria bacterium]|nr:hypothetical protein [Actinomycetota bacterium]